MIITFRRGVSHSADAPRRPRDAFAFTPPKLWGGDGLEAASRSDGFAACQHRCVAVTAAANGMVTANRTPEALHVLGAACGLQAEHMELDDQRPRSH